MCTRDLGTKYLEKYWHQFCSCNVEVTTVLDYFVVVVMEFPLENYLHILSSTLHTHTGSFIGVAMFQGYVLEGMHQLLSRYPGTYPSVSGISQVWYPGSPGVCALLMTPLLTVFFFLS